MKWVVLAIGICAIAFGSWWGWVGWSIVQVERGWTGVIAGSVLASAGLILVGLFGAILRVDALNKSVQRLVAASAGGRGDMPKDNPLQQHASERTSLQVPAPPPISSPPPPPSYAERSNVPPPPPSSLPKATFEATTAAGTAAVAAAAAVAATSGKMAGERDATGPENRESSVSNDTHAAVAAALFDDEITGADAPVAVDGQEQARTVAASAPSVSDSPLPPSPEPASDMETDVPAASEAAETADAGEIDESYAPADVAIAIPPRRVLPDFTDWPEPPDTAANTEVSEPVSAEKLEAASEPAGAPASALAAGGALAAEVAAVHASAEKPSGEDLEPASTETDSTVDLDTSQDVAVAEADADSWEKSSEAVPPANGGAAEVTKSAPEEEVSPQPNKASPEKAEFDDTAWLDELFEDELAVVDTPSAESTIAAAPVVQTAEHPVRTADLTEALNKADDQVQTVEERPQPAPDQPVDDQPAEHGEVGAEVADNQEELFDAGEESQVEAAEPYVPPVAKIPAPLYKPDDAIEGGSESESSEAAVFPTVSEQAPPPGAPADDAAGRLEQPATEQPREKPPLLRSYESQGITYYLYTDGSIEAQTPGGLLHFSSLQELRAFIEKRN